jgi:hypothetical protein
MKNISIQYQDLREGKMDKHQFLRNARMMFPNFVTNHNSFEDSIKILKNRGLLNEGDAVQGTPDKAPTYKYPNEATKYKKVEQSPEVDEQDGIYPATTLTDIPKEKMDKKVKDKSDGLEPIKPNDTKNEMKKIKIVKESKKKLTEAQKFEYIINNKPVDISSVEFDGIDTSDYPDFSDAYVYAAEFEDGTKLTDDELDELQDKYWDSLYDVLMDTLNENNQTPEDKLAKAKLGNVPKVDIGAAAQKWLSQFKSKGASSMGHPGLNKLKAKIKEMVREILDETLTESKKTIEIEEIETTIDGVDYMFDIEVDFDYHYEESEYENGYESSPGGYVVDDYEVSGLKNVYVNDETREEYVPVKDMDSITMIKEKIKRDPKVNNKIDRYFSDSFDWSDIDYEYNDLD